MQIYVLLLALLIVASEDIALASIKQSETPGMAHWFLVGLLFYLLVAIFLRTSFSETGIGLMNTLWSALSVPTSILVGYLWFNEKLTSVQLLAAGLATVAAVLVSG
jgi:multidrug transporter EmrE-like cation transporter